MEDRPIIVIADSALFDLGVSVGFGAVIGGLLAVALYQTAGYFVDKLAGLFRRAN
ncbi:hypothetical protein GGQ68_002536 [Sagittula marina]|uniref:Uncharacterized protein n=1 Tax=Sagittula marina TaxID=943940 RepID=A0A7W6DNC2_9RHOB|nr:hypothetical protein [Sagittula marina]MBB3986198.1 hypothetical protein [Sagittula marina]